MERHPVIRWGNVSVGVATFVALFGLTATPVVYAELCGKCQGRMFTTDVGKCVKCKARTSASAKKLCAKCQKKIPPEVHICPHCKTYIAKL